MSGTARSAAAPPAKEAEPKALTPAEVAQAVAELRWYTALQLEGVQAMLDGVTLGAEQVQDKRIELLEKGPEIDPGSEILLFVIVLLLESPAAAIAIRALLAPVARGIVAAITKRQARAAGQLAEDVRLFSKAAAEAAEGSTKLTRMARHHRKQRREWDDIAKQLQQVAVSLEDDLKGKQASIQRVASVLGVVTNQVPDYMVAGIKGVREVQGSGSSVRLPPGDSPGVSLRSAAMAAASRLRLTVKAAHETLEAELHKDGLMAREAREIIDVQKAGGSLNLADLTYNHQVATEAMIWARLLMTEDLQRDAWARPDRARQRAMDQMNRFNPSAGTPDPEPPREFGTERFDSNLSLGKAALAEYLVARFAAQIDEWATENNAFLPALQPPGGQEALRNPRPNTPFGSLPPVDQEDLLVQYLVSINERTPDDLVLR